MKIRVIFLSVVIFLCYSSYGQAGFVLKYDTAGVDLCNADTFVFSTYSGYTNYTWYKNGVLQGGENSYFYKDYSSTAVYFDIGRKVCYDSTGGVNKCYEVTNLSYINVNHIANIGDDVLLCDGDSVVLKNDIDYVTVDSIKWMPSDLKRDSLTVKTTGSYAVTLHSNYNAIFEFCYARDTVDITFNPLPVISLPLNLTSAMVVV